MLESAQAFDGASPEHTLAITTTEEPCGGFVAFDAWYKDYWTRVCGRSLPEYGTSEWDAYINGRDVAGIAWRAALESVGARSLLLDGLAHAVDTSAQLGGHVVSLVFVDDEAAVRFRGDLLRIAQASRGGSAHGNL